MRNATKSSWIILRRPALLWSSFGAIVVFAGIMIFATFMTASQPGGSRLTYPPLVLADLASASTPELLIGRPIMVTGTIAMLIAILHVATMYSSGSIRIQLIRQPHRLIWLAGTWITVVLFSIALTLVAIIVSLIVGWFCAAAYGVDTTAWTNPGVVQATLLAAGNLLLGMVAFALAGTALAFWLRSAIVAVGVGLIYTLFEATLTAMAPPLQGILPSSAFTNIATSGTYGGNYFLSLVAASVILTGIVTATAFSFSQRDILD